MMPKTKPAWAMPRFPNRPGSASICRLDFAPSHQAKGAANTPGRVTQQAIANTSEARLPMPSHIEVVAPPWLCGACP